MARTVGSTAAQTRGRVLAAAVELFGERGYAGTSMRDLAGRLGMTKASVYYHFDSKQALLVALTEPVVQGIRECVAAAAAQSVEETLRMLVDLFADHHHVLRSTLHDHSARQVLLGRPNVFDSLVELERAIAGSSDRADILRARCAIGAVRGAVVPAAAVRALVAEAPVPSDAASPDAFSAAERRSITAAACAAAAAG